MKIKYSDKVRVIEGFYENSIGYVLKDFSTYTNKRYEIEIKKQINGNIIKISEIFYENELELIK